MMRMKKVSRTFITCFILNISISWAQECWITGICKGVLIGTELADNKEICLESCKEDELCNWLTYDRTSSICLLFAECSSLSAESCPDCISGERTCKHDYQCHFPGECQGNFLLAIKEASPDVCLTVCKETEGCHWFTHHQEDEICVLLETCPTVDESCQSCISGEQNCPYRGKKLLVVTGYSGDLGEVIHFVDDVNVTSKCDNIDKVPRNTRGAFGGVVGAEGYPMVCGGFQNEDYTTDCFQYKGKEIGWEQSPSLLEKRGFSGSAIYRDELWVTGGYDRLNTSELFSGGVWIPHLALPDLLGFDRHCFLAINDSLVMLIGGDTTENTFSEKVYLRYEMDDDWTRTTGVYKMNPEAELKMYLDLAFGRYGHACGVLRDNDGTATHVVVVGGYGVDGLLQETEIFDLNDWNWSKGPPMAIYGAGMTEDGDGGVLLIGGRQDSDDRFDTIYKFKMGYSDWKLVPQALEDDREYPVAFFIHDKFTSCD